MTLTCVSDIPNLSVISFYHAEQIIFSVGYGIHDVPRMTGVSDIENVR